MEEEHGKLVLFQKLGYKEHDIRRILEKLGATALENDILQELILLGKKPQLGEGNAPSKSSTPRLVARGCSGVEIIKQREYAKVDGSNSSSNLRAIVIDGSNVAMSHGYKERFSCRGIQLAVEWFSKRGHEYIKVFVPSWRKEHSRNNAPITDQHILEELEKKTVLVYTPSRKVNGKRIVCYDDRYIVKLAYEKDGIIVSNDNYRDLQSENTEWKRFIEQRLLMYSFVNDKFMPPDDPLGRHGPTLYNFLRKTPASMDPERQLCPYDKKCTYGMKCKFYHPERLNQKQLSVADELRAKTKPVLIPSEKDNELLRKGHAAFNPITSVPSCFKWPELIQRASESSTSFQLNQIQLSTQKRQLEGSVDECDVHSYRLHEKNTFLRLYPAEYWDMETIEKSYSGVQMTDRSYPQVASEKVKGGSADMQCCCSCDRSRNDHLFKPHTHSLDCTCIKMSYAHNSFVSEDLSQNKFLLRRPCCYTDYKAHIQPSGLHAYCGHQNKQAINIQSHAEPATQCPTVKPHLYGQQEEKCLNLSHPPIPAVEHHWKDNHNRDSVWYSRNMEDGTTFPMDTELHERKQIHAALCGIFPAVEVDKVMTLYPTTNNIRTLIALIQKVRHFYC